MAVKTITNITERPPAGLDNLINKVRVKLRTFEVNGQRWFVDNNVLGLVEIDSNEPPKVFVGRKDYISSQADDRFKSIAFFYCPTESQNTDYIVESDVSLICWVNESLIDRQDYRFIRTLSEQITSYLLGNQQFFDNIRVVWDKSRVYEQFAFDALEYLPLDAPFNGFRIDFTAIYNPRECL